MFRKLAGLTALAGLFLAGTALAEISNSAHDFAQAGAFNATDGRICVVCHATHSPAATSTDAPLWNHAASSATYATYVGFDMQNAPASGVVATSSKLCLSCHDGTVGVDNYGGSGGTTLIGSIDPRLNVGFDLTDDHPISMTYDNSAATGDTELNDPGVANAVTTVSGAQGSVTEILLNGGTQVECGSCHDVHNTVSAGVGENKLLRVTNAGSDLCFACHNK